MNIVVNMDRVERRELGAILREVLVLANGTPDLGEVKVGIARLRDLIVKNQEKLMAKIDDLNAKIDEVAAEIEKQLAVISATGTSDADMDKAIARVQTAVDRLKSDNVVTEPTPTP